MAEYVNLRDRQNLLTQGLVFDDFELASGRKSSVKFEFDNIQGQFFDTAVDGIARCIASNYDPDDINTLVTVATGANRLGQPVVEKLEESGLYVSHVASQKRPHRQFDVPELPDDTRAVLIDDVFTTGGSLEKVRAEIEADPDNELARKYGAKVVGGVVLFNRSLSTDLRLTTGAPIYNVVHHVL